MDCYPEERYVFSASRVALKTFYVALDCNLGYPPTHNFRPFSSISCLTQRNGYLV